MIRLKGRKRMSPERPQTGFVGQSAILTSNSINMIVTPMEQQRHINLQSHHLGNGDLVNLQQYRSHDERDDLEVPMQRRHNNNNSDEMGDHFHNGNSSNTIIEEEAMGNVISEEHVISSEDHHHHLQNQNHVQQHQASPILYHHKQQQQQQEEVLEEVEHKQIQHTIFANHTESVNKMYPHLIRPGGPSKVIVLKQANNETYLTGNTSTPNGIVLVTGEQFELGPGERHFDDVIISSSRVGGFPSESKPHNKIIIGSVDNSATPATTTTTANTTTDEDLTSLTWLQDKNLIRGINLTCAKVQSPAENNGSTGPNSGHMSPTSDFLDESCISENSSTTKFDQNTTGGDNSPKSSFVNMRPNRVLPSPKTTTAIHVSPGGTKTTTTVLEYHPITTLTNIGMTSSASPITKTIYSVNSNNVPMASESTNAMPEPLELSPSQQQNQQHHIHKKYRREEHVKIVKQQQQQLQQQPLNLGYDQMQLSGLQSQIPFGSASPQKQPHLLKYSMQDEPSDFSVGRNSNHSVSASPHKNSSSNKQKHPNNLPYDPFVHTTNKPPLSFSSLIFMAIENSIEKALPVKEIYAWIVKHFPYFKTAPTGWKNSVRHNLSLNKCFQKVEKAPNMGKGSLWRVEQQYRQVLMQALTRSPYTQHQFTAGIEKTGGGASTKASSNGQIQCRVVHSTDNNNNNLSYNSLSSSNVSSASSSPTGGHQISSKATNGRHYNSSLYPLLSKAMADFDSNNNSMGDQDLDYHQGYTSRKEYQDDDDYCEGDEEDCYEDDYVERSRESRRSRRHLAHSNDIHSNESSQWVMSTTDSIDDVNAATAMLALKHGPKIFTESFPNGRPVITSSPSEDHTYTYSSGKGETTTTNGVGENNNDNNMKNRNGKATSVDNLSNTASSSDAAYESSEESHLHNNSEKSPAELELEEQRKKADGVDALLNLASGFAPNAITILKRRSSEDLIALPPTSGIIINSNVLSSPSPPKKSKTRTLRAKLKNKTWSR